MNLWSYRFSQNTKKKLSRFLPSLQRGEILTVFCSYFGRNNDFINSFWNRLTFRAIQEYCASKNVLHQLMVCGIANIWRFQTNPKCQRKSPRLTFKLIWNHSQNPKRSPILQTSNWYRTLFERTIFLSGSLVLRLFTRIAKPDFSMSLWKK